MSNETKQKIYEMLHAVSDCYVMYRCIFLLNVPVMIYVPVAVLVLREHVDGAQIFNSCTGWIFSLLCWKSMRWDIFIDQCKELWRWFYEQIKGK